MRCEEPSAPSARGRPAAEPADPDQLDGHRLEHRKQVIVFHDWTAPHAGTGSFIIATGSHDLMVRYFQNLGGAQLHMNW